MRAIRLTVAVIVMTSVLLPPERLRAQIASMNGNNLYADCIGRNTEGPLLCLGYVTAIMDVLSVSAVNRFKACVPTDADMNQIMDVVKFFIRDHAEKRHLVAAGLVAEALATAFPCQRTR
jgi:Ssp1 endopeptidase immunity protein Rap1a